MWKQFKVIDADAHMHEPKYLSDRYVESKYRDQVPKVAFMDALKYVVGYLKGGNIVWNTDNPHPDAIEPSKALPELDAQPITDEARRKILWDNAIKLFGPRILN